MHMDESGGSEKVDIEALLASMRPPSIPDEAFESENIDLYQVRSWNKGFAASALAGMSTVPDFHANEVRLDWLQRLVLSKAGGRTKARPTDLARALNSGLDRAKVLRLEDPIEDSFCEALATSRGNYRIFTGCWEAAGPYTQTLLDAFETLPPGRLKDSALTSIYSLLTISDEIARRANVDYMTPSAGTPKGQIAIPGVETLKQLARRVRFTNEVLSRLGINRAALTPFFLEAQNLPYVSAMLPGESPFDFYPLIEGENGVMVISPAGISLAVRAVMVEAAKRAGAESLLTSALLAAQQMYADVTGFWPVPVRLPPPDRHFLRSAVCKFETGRFLQVIQVPATFDQFPEKAFGSVRELGDEASGAIAHYVQEFWRLLKSQTDYREGITVLLLSGWGAPHSVAPPIEDEAPPNWRYVPLSFAAAAVLGACDNGKLRDICRMLEQVERLEADGFAIRNMNGILNLFGFWRMSNGNLIPEHMRQIKPPCKLVIPTDDLLIPRREAVRRKDQRSLPFIDGTFKWVQRENWDDDDDLQSIYGSLRDVVEGRLLGVVVLEGRTWWIESLVVKDAPTEWRYRTWQAVLQWLNAVGKKVISRFPNAFSREPARIGIGIPAAAAFERISTPSPNNVDLARSVVGGREGGGESANVVLMPEWLNYLRRPENDAEVELIAAVLEQLASPNATGVSRDGLREVVRVAVGSANWRWMHAGEALTPLERLASRGVLGRFKEIPFSAFTLAKCRSVWHFRDRSEGLDIEGEAACEAFLAQYRKHFLDELIKSVRLYDRRQLVVLAAQQYQAARHEQSRWRRAIRAMRAISGAAADQKAFGRQNAINALQRATKSIMEVAACEAPFTGGLKPERQDLDEMFAKALLLFTNGQLFASIRAGLLEPKLAISPAGDLLSERSVFDAVLKPAAEWMNARALNEADRSYGRDRAAAARNAGERKLPLDQAVRGAIEAEYGVSAEAFVDLQFAVLQIIEGAGVDAVVMKRSMLSETLAANDAYPSDDPMPLLKRLTLSRRGSWLDRSSGLAESDIDLSRFDRPFSLIGRPLLALDDDTDPLVLVAPMLVSDSTMYALSGLMDGSLQNQFWTSPVAKQHVGEKSRIEGLKFEEQVADRLKGLGLQTRVRCKLSTVLNEKVSPELGDIDVLAVSSDRRRVWVIEAKNLRLCRTEVEVAARLSEYRGRLVKDSKGREKPDKLLRHIRRVQYLRERVATLRHRMQLDASAEVRGLLIVDAPQPMNFYMLNRMEDAESAFLDAIDAFRF